MDKDELERSSNFLHKSNFKGKIDKEDVLKNFFDMPKSWSGFIRELKEMFSMLYLPFVISAIMCVIAIRWIAGTPDIIQDWEDLWIFFLFITIVGMGTSVSFLGLGFILEFLEWFETKKQERIWSIMSLEEKERYLHMLKEEEEKEELEKWREMYY